jgi:hypothetical protein
MPLSVGFVILDPSRGRGLLELLARIASIALRGLAETLSDLTGAHHDLVQLGALDD